MREPAGARRGPLRIGVVALLLSAAWFTALPWVTCVESGSRLLIDPQPDIPQMARLCTFGNGGDDIFYWPDTGVPGFEGPFYGFVIATIVYLVAALYIAINKRSV